MVELRLARLPDRTPVKMSLTLMPELHAALTDYARLYEELYGRAERIEDLVPAMLSGFLESDRAFMRRRATIAGKST